MIYIIITTCLNNRYGIKNQDEREKRYTDCINHLLELLNNNDNVQPIIVENNGERNTFLNNLNCDICYTDNNKYNFKNKGGNELLDIKSVIHKYNIHDNDTIIKLTGRYKILNLDFINVVINNCHRIDAFVKFFNVATRKYHDNKDDCVLGLFALKCKYLKNFEYKYKESPEIEIAVYIRENIENTRLLSIKNLSLECCFACNFSKLIV